MKRINQGLCLIDRNYFYTKYAEEFNQLTEETKNDLEIIFSGIENYETSKGGAFTKNQIAYILATIRHETGNFKPVKEYFWGSESSRKKYFEEHYDPILATTEARRKNAKKYGNTTQGDGVKYSGRGFVQITWKSNYKKVSTKFGNDFVSHPDLALLPKHSIQITLYGFDSGMFTGKNIHDFINQNQTDYYNARKVINGLDKAEQIKVYAEKFEKCLKIEK